MDKLILILLVLNFLIPNLSITFAAPGRKSSLTMSPDKMLGQGLHQDAEEDIENEGDQLPRFFRRRNLRRTSSTKLRPSRNKPLLQVEKDTLKKIEDAIDGTELEMEELEKKISVMLGIRESERKIIIPRTKEIWKAAEDHYRTTIKAYKKLQFALVQKFSHLWKEKNFLQEQIFLSQSHSDRRNDILVKRKPLTPVWDGRRNRVRFQGDTSVLDKFGGTRGAFGNLV